MVLDSPYLVLYGNSESGGRDTSWTKLFLLLTEDLNTVASLVKTVRFPGFHIKKFLCRGLVWGYLLTPEDSEEELSRVPFEKRALLDLQEQTHRNRIPLPFFSFDEEYGNDYLVVKNATCLIFIQRAQEKESQEQKYFGKKDFWMSGNATA